MVILCEDAQQHTFIYRLLKQLGFPRGRIRVEQAPIGGGSAEQWVRESYPNEVEVHRRKRSRMNIGLVTAIDADTNPIDHRYRQLDERLDDSALSRREDDEKICILVPKRNIETWIYALRGDNVDEEQEYPKLEREGNCQPAVKQLAAYLRDRWPNDIIPSLRRGCQELNHRLPE
jgi:hypothetical protein